MEFMERNEMGALCAWITLATVRERVEKRRTSPDWGGADDEEADAGDWEEDDPEPDADGGGGWVAARGEAGDGTGEG